jgi:tetratricopeptide (TPR) repeat protein
MSAMNIKNPLLSLGVVILTACAQAPHAESDAGPAPVAKPELPGEGLSEAILYGLLVGDVAAQRGDYVLAAESYAGIARRTRDPRVVKRAVELAVKAHDYNTAISLGELWVLVEPDSSKARQVLIPLLMGQERYRDALPHLRALMRSKERPPAMNFLHMQSLLGRYKDKKAGLELVRELAEAHADLPEAHYALSQVAWQAQHHDLAAKSLDEALRLRPGWETAALFRGQLHQRQGDEELFTYWRSFLKAHPQANEVRMAHAKALAKAGRYQEARAEFASLTAQIGDKAEIAYAIGLLSMQINDLDGAEASFKQAIQQGYADDETIRLYLAQISETRQRHEEALSRYDEIGPGERYFEARLKSVVLLGKMKRLVEGKARLDALTPANEREKVQIVQTEAQMLRDGGDNLGAFMVLDKAVRERPDSSELLYDRAMAAEKIDRLDVLEADLRRLIQLDPDHAHAYNALGYTLADRTGRLDEAMALLDKALKLAPDDAFILDSMGWALFKAKRYPEAESHLRRAYSGRPDPEIAAHLGEVLWQRGQREEARKLWNDALKQHPDNDVLIETVKRAKP